MSPEEAVKLVRQLQEAANSHNVSRLMELYADDAVAVSPVFGEVKGRAAIARTFERLFATLPDCAFELSDAIAGDDRIAILGTVAGTDRIGWFGLPPTGGPVRYRLTILCTLAGGKITRDERLYDAAGVVERLEKARLDEELRTAAEVQSALLPRTANAGLYWEAAGDSIPCRAIGGDFFQFIELPAGRFGVALGDVAGKGTPAALLAAMLQGMFAAGVQAGHGPAETLHRTNLELVARNQGSRFATLVYGILSPDGQFAYSNAGHNPPALLTRRGVHRLTSGGPPLGLFAAAAFEEATLRLDAQDTLLMFSDGVTEACDARGEEFGEERLLASAAAHLGSTPVEMIERILADVREFCGPTRQADDITVAVTRFRQPNSQV
ncbi:MAG TPA: SpoIIE family protein phosphatase [Candidatus Acidoferrales bacterium]|nr:SpoIIE family protein phosphatase [Candidatus Acidoferrales bacterium]